MVFVFTEFKQVQNKRVLYQISSQDPKNILKINFNNCEISVTAGIIIYQTFLVSHSRRYKMAQMATFEPIMNISESLEIGSIISEDKLLFSHVYQGRFNNDIVYVKRIPGVFLERHIVDGEIESIKNLPAHKYLLKYLGHVYIRNRVFLASETYNRSLQECLFHSKLPQNEIRIFRECVVGLQFLHDRQIVHGNLKPSNILVSSLGTIKLSDFGLHNIISQQTRHFLDSDVDIGILDWMAPEQVLGYRTGKSFQNVSQIILIQYITLFSRLFLISLPQLKR